MYMYYCHLTVIIMFICVQMFCVLYGRDFLENWVGGGANWDFLKLMGISDI